MLEKNEEHLDSFLNFMKKIKKILKNIDKNI